MLAEQVTAKILADNLRQLIALRGWNVQEIAEEAEVKASFVYDILNGKSTNPSAIKLDQLARAMHSSVDVLLHGSHSTGARDVPFIHPRSAEDALPKAPLQFQLEWLRQRTTTPLEQLSMHMMHDDSMAPTIARGDWMLCEEHHGHITTPGIYVLHDGCATRVLRAESCLRHQRPFVRLLPDNPRYSRDEIPADHVTITSRVIWHAQWL